MQLQAFTQWMNEEEDKQSKLAAHEEPVLESSSVNSRVVQLRSAFQKLDRKKKPAPPPVIKADANATGNHLSCCEWCVTVAVMSRLFHRVTSQSDVTDCSELCVNALHIQSLLLCELPRLS